MYVVLYLPTDNDPEVFGPFPTSQRAAQVMRRISAAAGKPINVGEDGALATIDIWIDSERNRYQLLKNRPNRPSGLADAEKPPLEGGFCLSGRRDSNPRPLDPQSTIRRVTSYRTMIR